MEKNFELPISDSIKDSFLRSTLLKHNFQNGSVVSRKTDESLLFQKLKSVLKPNLPAKDLISTLVRILLEVNFGESFTSTKGFDKIVEGLSVAIMADPILRKDALSIISVILDESKKVEQKNLVNG